MSLETPPSNKMMQTAPAKKEFYFAATADHYAEVVYAETIQEAEKIYHSVKRFMNPPPEQSTVTVTQEPEKKAV